MLIEAKMPKSLDIGDWFPEDDSDPTEEEKDIIIKATPYRYPVPGIIGMFNSGRRDGSVLIKACRRAKCMLCSQDG